MSVFAPLQSRKDVWLNDLAFSSVDEHGNRWIISDIDGWWDLPTPTMGEVDRAYSEDGSYYEPGRFEARVIRMTGRIIPPENSTNSANLARKELNKRLMLVRKTGLLRVLESPELGGGKQSEVVIVARPLVSSDKLNGVIDFDIQFRAPDPRKYSVDPIVSSSFLIGDEDGGRTYDLMYNRTYGGQQDQSTALVVNAGDYDTYGTIRIHGPIDDPGAFHLETDRHISFPGVRLTVGEYVDINLQEKTIITESGISLRDRMSDDSRWFKFEVGDNRVYLSGTQYLDPIPSVPDVKNLVHNPSYEVYGNPVSRVVRTNVAPNPSGMVDMTTHEVRESVFSDSQAEDGQNFTDGSVHDGYAVAPSVNLLYDQNILFPVDDEETHHFVQMDVKPTTDGVLGAELRLGDESSGTVPTPTGTWTTVRVDSHIPSEDYEVKLNIPGASTTNKVQIRNIMVLRSSTPIAGEIDFWSPTVGVSPEGIYTVETGDGTYSQTYTTPNNWQIVGNSGAVLRVIRDDDPNTDGTYIIPTTTDDQIVDLGTATTAGTYITYGVLAEGLVETRLYDSDTGELLSSAYPSNYSTTYVSEEPVTPRIEATISVKSAVGPLRRKIVSSMITYDGGLKIFSDNTPYEDGYSYETLSIKEPAVELVSSFYTGPDTAEFNYDSRVVSSRSYEGSNSLEIRYTRTPETPEEVKATPITNKTDALANDDYYVKAKVMANKPVMLYLDVQGSVFEGPYAVGANPGHWTDVSFTFRGSTGDRPVITISPAPGEENLEIYVDTVGIMTDDVPYFDGSWEGPYEWTGAPNSSTSATIPVVGVPTARMDITHRNAWIG